jgi:pimeloyl-ACP methyl ester carboxylesterase
MSTPTSNNGLVAQPAESARRRGCLFYIRRAIAGLFIFVFVITLVGMVYQTVATELDKRNYPPRGQLYNVAGHQMHLYCTGEGSPTVILQAGGLADSLWWYWVQNQVATSTQVCAYDRPGMGWSEPVAGTRDADTMTQELHTLLQQAGVPAPYIMVGHSYGAVLTRIYAAQHPDEITGIVLVDSAVLLPDHFADQSEFDAWKAQWDVAEFIINWMTRMGAMRFIAPDAFEEDGYPAVIAAEIRALQARNQVLDADFAEFVTAYWALTKASAKAETLGDLPTIVLWSGETVELYEVHIEGFSAAREAIAAYSSNTLVQTIDGANHTSILGNEQYAQQVSDAIGKVIEAATTGASLD